MKRIIFAFCLAAVSACGGGGGSSNNACSDLNLRISNGDNCSLVRTPVVLVLAETSDGNIITCTGTMVTVDDVLTAAHCFPQGLTDFLVASETETFLASRGDVVRAAVHPDYTEFADGSTGYDFAMITLSRPISISPVPIITSSPVVSGDQISAYGFGADETGRTALERTPKDALKAGFMQVTAAVTEGFVAQYDLTGSSVCPGDSGGPAIKVVNGVSGIVGVTSFGSRNSCEEGSFAAFGSVQDPAALSFITAYAADVAVR